MHASVAILRKLATDAKDCPASTVKQAIIAMRIRVIQVNCPVAKRENILGADLLGSLMGLVLFKIVLIISISSS